MLDMDMGKVRVGFVITEHVSSNDTITVNIMYTSVFCSESGRESYMARGYYPIDVDGFSGANDYGPSKYVKEPNFWERLFGITFDHKIDKARRQLEKEGRKEIQKSIRMYEFLKYRKIHGMNIEISKLIDRVKNS